MPTPSPSLAEWAMLIAFLVNLIGVITGLVKGIGALVAVRDDVRDMKRALGTQEPPVGLLGDFHDLRRQVFMNEKAIVELKAFVGHPMRRSTDPRVDH